MKVGDLVKYYVSRERRMGIIVGFDDENDPLIRETVSGIVWVECRRRVEVISESR